MKICSRCKKTKEFSEFNKDSTRYDGVYVYCKSCTKASYRENVEKRLAAKARYREDNRELLASNQAEYTKKNKDKIEKYNNKPSSILRRCVNNRMRRSLGYLFGKEDYLDLLGCTLDEYVIYMENHFEEGMDWTNHGLRGEVWHIDHTIPISHFNLDDKEERHKCFNYKNTTPMWARENLKKALRERKPKKGRRIGVRQVGDNFSATFKGKHLGTFPSEDKAVEAYKQAVDKDFGKENA